MAVSLTRDWNSSWTVNTVVSLNSKPLRNLDDRSADRLWGKDRSINNCPIGPPASSRHTGSGRLGNNQGSAASLFRPERPLVSPAQASGLGSPAASESPNGRPFRPLSPGGMMAQGRWPWLVNLSGPWGLKRALFEAVELGTNVQRSNGGCVILTLAWD